MRLKKRILLSIILCLLVPLVVIASVVWLILRFQVQLISVKYNVNTNMIEVIQNSPSIFEGLAKDNYRELLETVTANPGRPEDTAWIRQKNEELSDKDSFLCLRVDGEIVYVGDQAFFDTIAGELPEYSGAESVDEQSMFVEGQSHALIRQIDYLTPEAKEASLFIITDINHLLPQLKHTIVEGAVVLLVALTITTVIVVTLLYRSIVRPLTTLSVAANQIRDGNLDYEIRESKQDEIGQLQRDFEAMRLHLKEMTREQLRFQQDSRELLANISHDLKTPLTAIKGYTEGLLDGVADTEEKQGRYLRTIHSKATDMERMVEELVFFTKLEQQVMTYNFREIRLQDFLNDCIEESRLDMERDSCTISCSEPGRADLTVVFDPEHIKRVLGNIIGNSVKYMDKKEGQIDIRVQEGDDRVWIAVSDNGRGIPESDLQHIFDRFYRGDSSRSTKKGGSGLGLSIVKSIVEAHGGTVGVESKEGEGTTVRFSLPKMKSTAGEPESETDGGKKWRKKKNKKS